MNEKGLEIDVLHKPTIENNYPTMNYVRIEHTPTGITVTKKAQTQR